MSETKEEVEELEKRLKENPFKPIENPLTKLIKRLKSKKDKVLIVDGEEQEGMSCLGMKVGDYIK